MHFLSSLSLSLFLSILLITDLHAAPVNSAQLEQTMEGLRIKAESGDAPAALQLGDIYARGDVGTHEHDYDSAVRFYGLAADLNDESALTKMKALPPAYTSAWWQKRADAGDETAMRGLGESYAAAPKPDWDSVARCYGEAADAGDALSLEQMKTLPYEFTCAWWERKAFNGDAAAAKLAAQSYEDGRGVDVDRYQAVRFYAIAAQCGDATAVESLKNLPLEETVTWWNQRAMDGDVEATLYLVNAYATAQLGYLKLVAAVKYCILAAVQGEIAYIVGILAAIGLFCFLLTIRPTRGLVFTLSLLL